MTVENYVLFQQNMQGKIVINRCIKSTPVSEQMLKEIEKDENELFVRRKLWYFDMFYVVHVTSDMSRAFQNELSLSQSKWFVHISSVVGSGKREKQYTNISL